MSGDSIDSRNFLSTGRRGIVQKFGLSHYPDGEKLSPRLPKAYQMGNSSQNCGNCLFLKNNKCTAWKANVREKYWCKSWKHGISLTNRNVGYDELKQSIMKNVRRRIKPESIHKNRMTKNVRNERIRNKLVKNNLNKLELTSKLNVPKVGKLSKDSKRKASSIGSLKRSRRRK
tara:strand:+ start:70 stop:588 length:519 start_codon:yes stop_codon:yes gene_type:complete